MIFVLRGLLLELKGTEIFEYKSVLKEIIQFKKHFSIEIRFRGNHSCSVL